MNWSRNLVIAAVLLWPTCLVGQARSGSVTRERLTVPGALDEWTASSIIVAPGDLVIAVASGHVRIGQYLGDVGPRGTASGEGALQLRIGTVGSQLVGDRVVVIADQGGPVKLRVSDTRYTDNSGSFDVLVIRIPAASLPELASLGGPGLGTESTPIVAETPLVSQVKRELRSLVTAEETFFADHVTYSNSLSALHFATDPGLTLTILRATGTGWSATATHTALVGWTCGIFVGDAPPPVVNQFEGEPQCWRR